MPGGSLVVRGYSLVGYYLAWIPGYPIVSYGVVVIFAL